MVLSLIVAGGAERAVHRAGPEHAAIVGTLVFVVTAAILIATGSLLRLRLRNR